MTLFFKIIGKKKKKLFDLLQHPGVSSLNVATSATDGEMIVPGSLTFWEFHQPWAKTTKVLSFDYKLHSFSVKCHKHITWWLHEKKRRDACMFPYSTWNDRKFSCSASTLQAKTDPGAIIQDSISTTSSKQHTRVFGDFHLFFFHFLLILVLEEDANVFDSLLEVGQDSGCSTLPNPKTSVKASEMHPWWWALSICRTLQTSMGKSRLRGTLAQSLCQMTHKSTRTHKWRKYWCTLTLNQRYRLTTLKQSHGQLSEMLENNVPVLVYCILKSASQHNTTWW